MVTACEKRRISMEQLNGVVDRIETEVFNGTELEVPTTAIGEHVSEALRQLDQVAYVRFTSVYRDFADVGEFERMLRSLRRQNGGARVKKERSV
jgi:transcriptional repressor NrdR